MILKLVEHRIPTNQAVSSDDWAAARALGNQVQWISGLTRALIVEHVAEPGFGESFREDLYIGRIASEQDARIEEKRLAEADTSGPLPRTRWMVVWFYYADGGVGRVCIGDSAECYLMNDDGKTIDKLM